MSDYRLLDFSGPASPLPS